MEELLEFLRALFRVFTLIVALLTAPTTTALPTPVQTPKATLRSIPKPTPKLTPKPVAVDNRVFSASVAKARQYAHSQLGGRQFACLDALWQRESRWRVDATNKTSGAYGIPQALPPEKMAKAGNDWRTNPLTQVKWGLGYISGRYGTACSALQHAYEQGWY